MEGKPHFLFSVDPSLSSSGWALFALKDGMPLAAGVVTSLPASVPLSTRLEKLQSEVEQLFCHFRMGKGDILVCEGPAPLVLNPKSSEKVERVRGIFEALARARDVKVPGRINPRTLQAEMLGLRGRQLSRQVVKSAARAVAGNLFGNYLSQVPIFGVSSCNGKGVLSQDIVDALLIGALAVSRVRVASATRVTLEEVFSVRPGRSQSANGTRAATRWCEREFKNLLGNQK